MKLAVALLLADGTLETEPKTPLEIAVADGVTATLDIALPDSGAGVAEAAADEEPPVCTAGPTSGCFPEAGSVLSPQLEPAALNVLPYMRQMLMLSGPAHWRQLL